MSKALALLAAMGVALVLLAACEDNEGLPPTESPSPAPTITASPTPAASPSPPPSPEPFAGTRGPVGKADTGTAPPVPTLVGVTTGRHEGFDRAVFEFERRLPGYRIEYIEPPVTAGGPRPPP